MLISPGGEEVGRVIDLMPMIERDDPSDAGFVAVGVGDGWIGREVEPIGLEDKVVGDLPGRGQVFLQKRRRHTQGFARRVKSRFVGGVDREFASGPEVNPGKVANGVVGLGVAQATGQDGARIARVFEGFARSQGLDPRDDGPSIVLGWLLGSVVGRHLLGLDSFEHEVPDPVVLDDRRNRCIGAQVEFRLLLLRAVTAEALALQERMHDRLEVASQRRLVESGLCWSDGNTSEQNPKYGHRGWHLHQRCSRSGRVGVGREAFGENGLTSFEKAFDDVGGSGDPSRSGNPFAKPTGLFGE